MYAVLNRSSLPDADVDAFAQAVDAQLRDDFCPHWPAVVYQPVALVANASIGDTVITIVDPPARGGQGSVLQQSGEQTSVDLSQLVLALAADPTGTTWVPMPDGRSFALDPTATLDGYTYTKMVGQRAVSVGNFIFPTWFDAAPVGRVHNFLGTYDAWVVAPGGFLTIRAIDGVTVSDIMGSPGRAARRASMLGQPSARTRGVNVSDVPAVQCGRMLPSAFKVTTRRGR